MGKNTRLGIGIVVAVWLLIMLVPPLNYYFRLQVHNETEINAALAILPSPASTPNFWEKTARRFPDSRDVLYQAALERPGEVGGVSEIFEWVYGPFPIDPKLPPSVVFPGPAASDTRAEWIRRIDILRRKFPPDPFLVAIAIRARMFSLKLERTGGELSDPLPRAKRPPGYVSPERHKEKTNFTPADFQETIELCRLGQKLEPENGYFDWMECYFSMHAWRDEEAFKALETVGRKKQYDEHVGDEISARINALSIAWDRPLLYEEKAVPFSSYLNLQHSRYRELARVVAWQAIKAQRRGDRAQATRIAVALGRAGAKMRDNSRTYIDGLVAMAIEAIGWHSLTADRRVGLPRVKGGKELRKKQHQILLAYLTEHRQPELAAEFAQSEVLYQIFRTQMLENRERAADGTAYQTAFFILLLWAGGIKLLLLLLVPFLMVVLMEAGKSNVTVRHWLRWDESGADEVPPVREVWNGVLACMGWRVWAIVIGASLFVIPIMIVLSGGWDVFLHNSKHVPFLKILSQESAFDGYSYFWANMNVSLIEVVYITSPWRFVVFCTPILFGTPYAVWRAVEWQKRRNGEASAWLSPGRAVDFVIMLVLAWSLFAQAFAEYSPKDFETRLIVVLITLFCVAVLLSEKFLAWRKRPHRRAAVRYGLRLFQRSLFSWLVLGSVIYLISLIATATVRSEADRAIDRVLAMGEVRATQEP